MPFKSPIPDFNLQEFRAFKAWFRGGRSNINVYFARPDFIHWGKGECEWVDFYEFWLGKIQKNNLFTVRAEEIRQTFGKKLLIGIRYHFTPTEKAYKIIQDFYNPDKNENT